MEYFFIVTYFTGVVAIQLTNKNISSYCANPAYKKSRCLSENFLFTCPPLYLAKIPTAKNFVRTFMLFPFKRQFSLRTTFSKRNYSVQEIVTGCALVKKSLPSFTEIIALIALHATADFVKGVWGD